MPAMPEEEWEALGPHEPDPVTGRRRRSVETHPQFHLKLLLDRMGVARGEVERWRWGGGRDAPARTQPCDRQRDDAGPLHRHVAQAARR